MTASDKWIEGYNDGYLLGSYDTVVEKIIYAALESAKNDYGLGLRLGYKLAREHDERRKMNELRAAREKGSKSIDKEI